jgi:hypothetical protein
MNKQDEEAKEKEEKKKTSLKDVTIEKNTDEEEDEDDIVDSVRPFLMGKVAAVVNEKKSAKAIVDEMVTDAAQELTKGYSLVAKI